MNSTQTPQRIFDFNSAEELSAWQIVNDGVMGGRSQSQMYLGENSTAIFKGQVSLENNGGFASVRGLFPSREDYGNRKTFKIRLRGDGKRYQFRLRKGRRFDGASYCVDFDTKAGEWQVLSFQLEDFEARYRGRVLSGYASPSMDEIGQIGILIADKQVGDFEIALDWIEIED